MSSLHSLLDDLRAQRCDVNEALDSGAIPEHIAHHFACDCTERAWLQGPPRNSTVQELTRTILQLKRNWIEDDVSIKDARRVMEALQHNQPLSTDPQSSLSNAWHMIRTAWEVVGMASVFLSPDDFASMTHTSQLEGTITYLLWKGELQLQQIWGDESPWKNEQEWQRTHLADLLEQYVEEQQSFIELLLQRWEKLDEDRKAVSNAMEEQLFEEGL